MERKPPITLSDSRRWKNHYRSFKKVPLAISYGNPSFRENYDKIDWRAKRADDPFLDSVVFPNIGEGDWDDRRRVVTEQGIE